MLNNIKINLFEYPNFTQFYITLDLNHALNESMVHEEYSNLNKYLTENGIQVVYEKCFGQLSFKDKVLDIKRSVEREKFPQWPLSYIEGNPALNSFMSSITIMGIRSLNKEVKIEYIEFEDRIIGTKMIDLNEEYLYLMGLASDARYGTNEFNVMFEQLKGILNISQFSEGDIVRTWIYLNDIKDNYVNFNEARRIFFEQSNIDYSSSSNVLPASTCIHGITDNRSTAMIDVMCIKKMSTYAKIDRIYTPLLNEAEGDSYLFKPTFSRALSIDSDNHIEIQLSGTASVDQNGETVFKDDPYKQIQKTLTNIGSLLSVHDLTFKDFVQSTCFFKSEEYYIIFQQVMQEMNIPHFSSTFVIGDICRQDLLCEIDGVIKKNKKQERIDEIQNGYSNEVTDIIRKLLQTHEEISLEENLRSKGMDSLKTIELIVNLESTFDINFNNDELLLENFESIRLICDLINIKK